MFHFFLACGCKSEYSLGFGCNAQTGQCECLQGVVGEKCDQCPYRWAFVPEVGCHACDSCHHALLNDTDELAAMIDPVIFEFDLKDIDPKQISLDETIQELESLEQDTKNLNRKSNYSLENSEQLKNKSDELKDTLEILLDDINTIEDVATMTIDDINTITMQLTKETGKHPRTSNTFSYENN
ncbi:unnamed protein product [Acanthoscelides obtectus]|uniref:Laminin EGF-like domain-containing protein n=1 Tax=Acanthoscelides obtectus TaxID=200917 RepID=A0A9P0P3J5_ACAOB|nr:unnamed protein product [Acanthoscelides obtectus]CAK1654058.1 Laminin subunit alpha [Acanthoscelides obtectus]